MDVEWEGRRRVTLEDQVRFTANSLRNISKSLVMLWGSRYLAEAVMTQAENLEKALKESEKGEKEK